VLPALPVQLAALAEKVAPARLRLHSGKAVGIGMRRVAIDAQDRLALGYHGPSGTFRHVGLLALLDGAIPAGVFTERLVLVGATAGSLGDSFATPFDPKLSGIEVLATAAANLREDTGLGRGAVVWSATLALALAGGCLCLLAGSLRADWLALVAGMAVWLGAAGAVQGAFAAGHLWLDAVAVLAGLAAGTATAAAARYGGTGAHARRMQAERANLGRYVPSRLTDELARAPVPRFDRREQEAAILFADVIGYTARTETAAPSAVATLLRALHEALEARATAHGGIVANFQGDGAMIVFGLPEPGSEDAANALACAKALRAGVEVAGPGLEGWPPLRLRLGLHCGPVAAAVLGGRAYGQVSVTGDTVNLASRLQEAARAHDTDLAVTQQLLIAARVDPDDPDSGCRRLDRQPLRGRSRAVEIFTLAASPA
jgi:adenylate cyclase